MDPEDPVFGRGCILAPMEELNNPMKVEVVRALYKKHLEVFRRPGLYYVMSRDGSIIFKVDYCHNLYTNDCHSSSDEDLIQHHSLWFSANRQLLSLKTFTGRDNKTSLEYHIQSDKHNKGLLDMPLEVFENLVWYLDGFSFYSLCKISPELDNVLNEALNEKQYNKYWESRKNDMDIGYAAKIITSFSKPKSETMAHSINKQMQVCWSEVFKLSLNLNNSIEKYSLSLESLKLLEKAIKTELKIGFVKEYPQRITIPCGSVLVNIYNDISHYTNDENISIMEDMNPSKTFRMGVVCQELEIANVHIMRLILENNVVELIITVCPRCVCVYPVMDGNGLSIRLVTDDWDDVVVNHGDDNNEYDDDHSSDSTRRFPPSKFVDSNIYRDVLGVLANEYRVELHRISYVNSQVFSELLHRIELNGFSGLLEHARSCKYNYITTVREIDFPAPMSEEDKCYYTTAQIDPPLMTGYALSIISYDMGHFLIRPRDASQIQTISYSSVCKMSPIYYKEEFEDLDKMKYPAGSCSDHGMIIFWSDEAIAVSFDSVTWHIKSFYDGVRNSHREPHMFKNGSRIIDPLYVVSVQICSPDLILVAIDKELVFITLKLEKCQNTLTLSEYPIVTWDVIRRIDFDLSSVNLYLKSLHFGLARGNPYIFMELHDNEKLDDPFKFQFKRILLKRKEDEDDTGYLTILEDSFSGLDVSKL